jgi:hypothetical protein
MLAPLLAVARSNFACLLSPSGDEPDGPGGRTLGKPSLLATELSSLRLTEGTMKVLVEKYLDSRLRRLTSSMGHLSLHRAGLSRLRGHPLRAGECLQMPRLLLESDRTKGR